MWSTSVHSHASGTGERKRVARVSEGTAEVNPKRREYDWAGVLRLV